MKPSFLSLPKWQIALSCFILLLIGESTIAQNAANTNMETKIFYYGFALAILVLVVATVIIMRKARRILGEYGQPLFKPEFPIFKRMTKASTTVAIVMIALVLWGIYLVITYKAI
jgi:formate-dependent nitrite reductase membrane component NrfD